MTPEQRADRVFFITATEGVEAQSVIRLEIVKQIKWAVGEAVADAEKREGVLRRDAIQFAQFTKEHFIKLQDFERAKGCENWIDHFTLEVPAPKE